MRQARFVVIDGPDVGTEHVVPQQGTHIGRGEDCDLQLTDLAVSRSHCTVEPRGDRFTLVTAGARNKTQVNGRLIEEEHELSDGDELQVGRSRLVFLSEDDALHVVIAGTSASSTTELGSDQFTALTTDHTPKRQLAALAGLGDRIRDATRREDAALAACEVLRDVLGAARVAVLARDAAARLVAIAHVGYQGRDRIVSLREQLVERVVRERRVVLADAEAGHCVLAAPLGGAEATGLLYLDRPTTDPAPAWGETELHFVATAAHLLAGFLRQIDARNALVREVTALADRMGGSTTIVGDSARANDIRGFVARVAVTDSTVLLLGESGVGKELVASAIHRASRRSSGPFVCVNCAALSETLLESELFGHERGAFTGASERRIGRFELAEGGTLFLDEVAELTLRCQTRFLRVLEERRYERVGSTRSNAADVRVLAATNRDLSAMVATGEFREDLYFRLAVLQFVIPPLRERAEDLATLCEHLLDRIRAQTGRRPTEIAPDALAALRAYAWPGNVRELRNALEQAVVLGDGATIRLADLPPQIANNAARAAAPERRARSLKQWEEEAIRAALVETGGNKLRAAALLGIDRSTLYKRLRELGID
ncbi:MAG TPA: sigma 54-interacting transcriptional regulator [Kofleriaceae bacterium]